MNEYMRTSVKSKSFWETVMLIVLLCLVISVVYSVANKEPPQNKCIDGTLYRPTDQGYWLAYNQKCKSLPIEEISE
tara:strand:- start:7996 stop:8223 length:228 start_codon:yes stop_codon:yes gene_type:complete